MAFQGKQVYFHDFEVKLFYNPQRHYSLQCCRSTMVEFSDRNMEDFATGFNPHILSQFAGHIDATKPVNELPECIMSTIRRHSAFRGGCWRNWRRTSRHVVRLMHMKDALNRPLSQVYCGLLDIKCGSQPTSRAFACSFCQLSSAFALLSHCFRTLSELREAWKSLRHAMCTQLGRTSTAPVTSTSLGAFLHIGVVRSFLYQPASRSLSVGHGGHVIEDT